MLTSRQEKILTSVIREYLNAAEPISSDLLKKRSGLDVSPATIRNDLQELAELGYVAQPHTSAGRVPTEKAYRYFVEITFDDRQSASVISREIEIARQRVEKELALIRELTRSLEELSTTLSYTRLKDKDTVFEVLKIIRPSRTAYQKNIELIEELLEEFKKW
jgi:heat-inducible transcriptional repressor